MTHIAQPWQHAHILSNGVRLHYVTQGSGPLIVLLHGFPEYWYSWRFQIPFLAERGFRVVAPDLRGYNESDKPRRGYRISSLLLDIVGLIRGLGYEQATIVGHDWGGVLAWSFAASYPAMTERLIVLNAPHPAAYMRELRSNPEQRRKSWYVFFFQIPWLPEWVLGRKHAALIGEMLYRSAVQKEAFPHEVLMHYRDAMSKPGALTAALNYYRTIMRSQLLPGERNKQVVISAPTLLLWGEQDSALTLNLTRGLEPWVPHLRVQTIAHCGHWVQQEQPEVVNDAMASFLRTECH